MKDIEKQRFEWKLKRIAAKISQIEMADYMGYTSGFISQCESGKRDFSINDETKYKEYILSHTKDDRD